VTSSPAHPVALAFLLARVLGVLAVPVSVAGDRSSQPAQQSRPKAWPSLSVYLRKARVTVVTAFGIGKARRMLQRAIRRS
jgi:hypothetical protein